MALPLSIERNIAMPGVEQANFVKYLTDANLPISNSKTIAYQSLYHILKVEEAASGQGDLSATFFTGTYDATLTNFPGNSFVLPQSQHFLVTAIQSGYVQFNGATNTITKYNKGWMASNSQGVGNSSSASGMKAIYDLVVNGIVLQKGIPLSEFDNTLVTQNRGRFELSQPILIPAQSDISLRLTAKTGTGGIIPVGDDSNDGGVWFELIGIGLI